MRRQFKRNRKRDNSRRSLLITLISYSGTKKKRILKKRKKIFRRTKFIK